MSRCDYKIQGLYDDGGSNYVVIYSVFEGDITTEAEWRGKAGGGSEEVNITRYRRTTRLAGPLQVTLAKSTHIANLNKILEDNYVTGSRTAIDEQEA